MHCIWRATGVKETDFGRTIIAVVNSILLSVVRTCVTLRYLRVSYC